MCFNRIVMCVQVYGSVFTHSLIMQQTISMADDRTPRWWHLCCAETS